MRERILSGWNIGRVLYLMIGIYVIVATAMERHWFGILIGVYFASMAIFRFGCAAGNCYTGNVYNNTNSTADADVKYEEVK
jgi:hypothetical protein